MHGLGMSQHVGVDLLGHEFGALGVRSVGASGEDVGGSGASQRFPALLANTGPDESWGSARTCWARITAAWVVSGTIRVLRPFPVRVALAGLSRWRSPIDRSQASWTRAAVS